MPQFAQDHKIKLFNKLRHFFVPKALKLRHHQTIGITHENKVGLRIDTYSFFQMKYVGALGHTEYGHSNPHQTL